MKMYVAAFLAVVAYMGIGTGAYFAGKNNGIKEGLDNFHEACYTGGIIIHPETGKAVRCQPLGLVPKEELPRLLDKDSKTV